MTVRPPTLERPVEAGGPEPPEVLFREARRRRRRRYGVGALAIAAAGGLVAGLVSVSSSVPPRPKTTTAPRESTVPGALTSCSMPDLQLGITWAGAEAQAESYRVVMTNVSNHACKVEGAPSVSLLGQGAASLATHVVMTPSQAAAWAKVLRIAPSAPASFTVTLNQGGANPQPLPTCPVVTGISVSYSSTGDGTPATLVFPPLPVDVPPLRAYSTHPGYSCNQVYMTGVQSGH